MNVASNLLTMKREAEASVQATYEREMKSAGLWVFMWLAGCIIFILAFLAFAAGLLSLIASVTHTGRPIVGDPGAGLVLTIGGVFISVISAFCFKIPRIVTSRDKELIRLQAVQDTLYANYRAALESELSEYGISVDSIHERNDYMEADYEFTALQNGDPIDVNVREFNEEIVFMLNGERMKKHVNI